MTFEWPLLLFSLGLVPLILLFYVLVQRRRRAYTVRFTNLALLATVVGRKPGLRRHIPPLLFLVGLVALLVSLARPQAVLAVPRDQSTVMLAIDVSGSMTATDLQPSRIEAARHSAQSFVKALPENVKVGVVSFSASAQLVAAPTTDHLAVVHALAGLRANGGTAIGDGLNLALDELTSLLSDAKTQPIPGTIVLLSDGQSTSGTNPDTAAQRAQREQVKVFTVGIGERGANPFVGSGRTSQRVGLDETTLQNIATTTGAQYFYAAESSDLQKIYTSLGSQVSWVEERTEVTALFGGVGAIFLVFGGLLGLYWFRQLP